MDASEVKLYVDRNVEHMMRQVGVPHWAVEVTYEPEANPNWMASCNRDGRDYEHATINIDPAKVQTIKGLHEAIVHELFHIALASLDVYRDVMRRKLKSEAEDEQEHILWTHTLETAVMRLEQGIGKSVTALPEGDEDAES